MLVHESGIVSNGVYFRIILGNPLEQTPKLHGPEAVLIVAAIAYRRLPSSLWREYGGSSDA
jgi:hypothetical protein